MATKKGSSGNKKVYLIAGAILLGVAGYFGYNWWKKRQSSTNTDNQPPATLPTVDETPQVSSSAPTSVTSTSNPFKTKEEILKFQQWVINTKKDKTILGTGGSTGYGDDGQWGSKSASAWDKYGKEYLTGSGSGSGSGTKVYADLEKDISTIINNQNNSGQKAEKSYLRSVALKYPEFVQNWADAVRKRYDSKGKKGTTFIFANEIYDSFQAEKLASKYILGKEAYRKNAKNYVFMEASRYSSNYDMSSTAGDTRLNRGIVKGYFFNKDQRIFFLYIPNPNNSYEKFVWYPYSAIAKFV